MPRINQLSDPEETAQLLLDQTELMDSEGVSETLAEFMRQDGASAYDLIKEIQAEVLVRNPTTDQGG